MYSWICLFWLNNTTNPFKLQKHWKKTVLHSWRNTHDRIMPDVRHCPAKTSSIGLSNRWSAYLIAASSSGLSALMNSSASFQSAFSSLWAILFSKSRVLRSWWMDLKFELDLTQFSIDFRLFRIDLKIQIASPGGIGNMLLRKRKLNGI